ncbi:hypothetical protein BVRB_3g052170 isoform A [Beta vulgaris subsp. vulgaris]|nr:hypothetical protein BVRB_3g052170 isoform A [Beta vulgaris subsp. vulgaris]
MLEVMTKLRHRDLIFKSVQYVLKPIFGGALLIPCAHRLCRECFLVSYETVPTSS